MNTTELARSPTLCQCCFLVYVQKPVGQQRQPSTTTYSTNETKLATCWQLHKQPNKPHISFSAAVLRWRTPANQEWPRSNPACCPPRCGLCLHSKPANVATTARSCATCVLRAIVDHLTSKCCLRPTRFAQQVVLYKYHSRHQRLTPLGGTILIRVRSQVALGRALATTGIAARPSANTTDAGSATTRALFDFPACKWCISTCAGACSKQRWRNREQHCFKTAHADVTHIARGPDSALRYCWLCSTFHFLTSAVAGS